MLDKRAAYCEKLKCKEVVTQEQSLNEGQIWVVIVVMTSLNFMEVSALWVAQTINWMSDKKSSIYW